MVAQWPQRTTAEGSLRGDPKGSLVHPICPHLPVTYQLLDCFRKVSWVASLPFRLLLLVTYETPAF